jgi:hypothetical protein
MNILTSHCCSLGCKSCDDGILIELMTSWKLFIILFLFNTMCQETESSLQNGVLNEIKQDSGLCPESQ